MKIPHSVRALYGEQLQINERLKAKVDEMLDALAKPRKWHYESRIKSEISFAQKLESGRIADPRAAEDFFACTLVVQNLSSIEAAEGEARDLFTITERRPREADRTHKLAETFPFDDLRLYGHWKDDPALPESGLAKVKFEIQIKTFLQHAWGIATHDLIYKTDDVSWSRQRIAYQIKAMLEHAEVSIQEADRLALTPVLAKSQRDTERLKSVIALLKEVWDADSLPPDLRRLAENTRNIMAIADIGVEDLRAALSAERARQKGSLPINISPYAIILQAVAWHIGSKLAEGLKNPDFKERVLLVDEMDLPDWIRQPAIRNIIRCSAAA